jgi:6-phosphofructokinase 2
LLLASGREAVRAVPPPVQARNAVGAGDALLAGVIWALEQNRPMEEVARWGVATGTAAAMREGVRAGSRAEVERAYEGTNVWAMEGPAQRYP